ncbi:MAG: FAD-linked oxidase C-terminal domain-containing protein [Pseudomonadota bacterium]
MINDEAKKEFSRITGPKFFSDRPEDLVLYASDGTNTKGLKPGAVIRPGNVQEISDIIKTARKYKIPVTVRGAGSGLTGGALPVPGGLILVMTRLNRILIVDQANLTAVVEPGVVTADFQDRVSALGLFYPPDPASREFSTLGGNAAENAGGTRAVKYGVTRDYILGLQAVLGTGEIVETGVITAKGVVGYDLTRLLVGSEGTLAVITRLNIRLVPLPEAKETVIAYYDTLAAAGKTVAALTAARIVPATIEFMDRASINCVEEYLHLGIDPNIGALLLIETDGPPRQALDEAEAVVRLCRETGALAVRRAETREEAETMWQARRALSPTLYRVAPGKMNEDVVVPRDKIPLMVERIEEIGRRLEVAIICFGHAGDGNIHVNVMYDPAVPGQPQKAEEAVKELMSRCLELGGTISGEHGIGTTKRNLIQMELKPAVLDLMHRIKSAFDPDEIMNPGKMFPS